MQKLGIPGCEIHIAMGVGVYDLLTVLPRNKLVKKGIKCFQTMIVELINKYYARHNELNRENFKPRWDEFWTYFK